MRVPCSLGGLLVLLACREGAPRYGDGWSAGPPLPEAVQELHAVVAGGRIVVAGGIARGDVVTSHAYRLDAGAGTWARLPDLPEPRHHMPLAAVGDSVYALGGYGPSAFEAVATVWLYHPSTDGWVERAPLPAPRGASAAAAIGGRIVVVGGAGKGNVLLDSIAIYDASLGRWRHGAPIPTPRDHLTAVTQGGRVVAIGGRPLDPDRNFAVVERYDPATDRWSPAPAMPTARGGLAAAVLAGAIHVVGGETSHRVFGEHEVLESGGRWRTAPSLPTPRHGLAAAALDDRLYVIGGGPRAGLAQTAVVEVYLPGATPGASASPASVPP